MPREPFATPDEVAEYLRVKKQTLYNWRSTGRGPRATRIGGILRYAWADVEAYAAAGIADTERAGIRP